MTNNTYTTNSVDETYVVAKSLVSSLFLPGVTVALIGDLGAGKTTFVQGIAAALGIAQLITSPTFILLQQYAVESSETNIETLYHLDLYRLETIRDVYDLGYEEIIADEKGLVLIEWADKIQEILPKDTCEIRFEYIGESERHITVQSY